MVVGPVAFQGNIPRPPFSNDFKNVSLTIKLEVNCVIIPFTPRSQVTQKLKSQTQDFNVTTKQLPSYGDFTPSKVSRSLLKYPELYTMPPPANKSSKYPDFSLPITGEYDLPLFPVDTPNIIPDSSSASSSNFKQAPPAPPPNPEVKSASNGAELSYLFPEGEDFDLSSLLSIPLPHHNAGGDTEHTNYNIGDNNSMMAMDMFGAQPNLFDLDMMDHIPMESDIPDNIHYSHGLQKGYDLVKEPQATVDPFMSTLYSLPPFPGEYSPQSSVLDDVSMNNDQFDESSSVDMHSPSQKEDLTPHTPAASTSDKNWDAHNIFDISDLTDRYMFPPPKKRQENSPNNQYWHVDKKPPVIPPCLSPEDEHSPLTPPVPPNVETIEDHGIQPVKLEEKENDTGIIKSKPTLLFGKHEDEIIHKLLPKNISRSKPITRDKLITIPVEEFNQLLEKADLTEIEVAFMKEWRRRGKNKAAAQVARKRKREEVSELEDEVQKMRLQKIDLQRKCELLRSHVKSYKERSIAAEDELFRKQSLNSRERISRDTHLIHATDEKLFLIPHVGSKILIVNN